MFTRTASSLRWYTRTAGSLEGDLDGMFLTTGESLPAVDFSAAPGLLELPAPWVGFPELLAPY
jgi:hypothetical protein